MLGRSDSFWKRLRDRQSGGAAVFGPGEGPIVTALAQIHPGAILRILWLEGRDRTAVAAELGANKCDFDAVLDERASISPALAEQLEAGGWSTAAFWLRLQAAHDRARTSPGKRAAAS